FISHSQEVEMDEDLIRFASNEIINHVNANPESADTVQGIHQWWIQWPNAAALPTVTRAALEQLELEGFLQRLVVGGREVWRRRRDDSEREV
ncbi:hypothetical protein ACFFLM_08990, partial [Deinococcus oregonensis]